MTEQRKTREQLKKSRASEKKAKRSPIATWLKRIILTALVLGVLGVVAGAGLFTYYASKAPELDEELLKDPISSEILDKNGEVFAVIGVEENRKYVSYDEIPPQMIDAIIATEDARFFEHFGMDLWRLGGAVIANFRDGYGSQGASTITQQVVKNSFFSNAKTLERKAQEAWLAVQLERQYEKEEIFEMYFNKVLMSGTTYGFATAAERFYGVENLHDLTLEQMAVLAGIPQSPNNYNPFQKPERAQERRDIVLGLMVQHGKITQADADIAKKVNVAESVLPEGERKTTLASDYQAFLDVVLWELDETGYSSQLAEGIKVHTTLDPAAQKTVEKAMNDDDNFPTENIQSGLSVIDTKTGAIVAVGGGRHYENRETNFAYSLTNRSPGSTLKPITAYGPAIEYLKWSTGETLVDEPATYKGGKSINNWDGSYYGAITLREALYTSRNVPAVKTLKAVSNEQAQAFAEKLGVEVDYLVESDALGGGRVYLSPVELAAAYAAFGNNGIYHDAYAIEKIEYRDGSSDSLQSEPTVAMSEATAYMVTDVLRDVVSNKPNASGSRAAVSGVDIAGKTGTTNYDNTAFDKFDLPRGSVPDSWFVGYSTNYSIAVWSGYAQYSEPITSSAERQLSQKLFKEVMSELSENVKNSSFKKPSSVVEATIVEGSQPLKLASASTSEERKSRELFHKGTVPKQTATGSDEVKEEEEETTEEALTAPSVQATYDPVGQMINVSWSFNAATDEPITPTFEVAMQIDGGAPAIIATTGANSTTVSSIQPGSTYTFSVVAINGGERSPAGSASVQIEGTPEELEPEEPVVEEPTTEEELPEEDVTEPTAPVTPPSDNNGEQTPATPPATEEQPTIEEPATEQPVEPTPEPTPPAVTPPVEQPEPAPETVPTPPVESNTETIAPPSGQ